MCYLNSIRKSWLTVLRFPTHLDSLASVRCIRDGLFWARHTPHTIHGRHPILFLFLFSVNRALAGYKHIEIAWKGQSTVIFSKRRKISTIWTDPCVIRLSLRRFSTFNRRPADCKLWAEVDGPSSIPPFEKKRLVSSTPLEQKKKITKIKKNSKNILYDNSRIRTDAGNAH